MRDSTRICAPHSSGARRSSPSPAPTGPCCRSSCAIRSKAGRRSTEFCLASSAPPPSAARSSCQSLKRRLGADGVVLAGTIGTAAAMTLYGLARTPAAAIAASVLAGMSWIAVLATINVSAQVALPEWVRGRGLAAFVTVQFGGLAIGSVVWGGVATLTGLPLAHYLAAAVMIVTIPLLARWKLQTGAECRPDAVHALAGAGVIA